jgi:hypothetical protein
VHAGGVHLAGAQGEFLDPGQVVLVGPLDGHHQVKRAEEVLVGAGEGFPLRVAPEAGLVHLTAPPGVYGHHRRAEFRQAGQRRRLVRGIAANLGGAETDLGDLSGLIIDEGDGVHREVQFPGDMTHRIGLAPPADLGVHKVFRYSQLLDALPGHVVIVLASNRLQDAAGIESDDHVPDLIGQLNVGVFKQRALPQGIVEVPDQALHDNRLVMLRHGIDSPNDRDSCSGRTGYGGHRVLGQD